jgi:hypothetical protein
VVRSSCPQDRAAPASPPHRQPVRKPVRSRWGATNVTRPIHRPARPPRLWQASSATEPVASVHHRDCRDRRFRSRRTSPALTCRDRLRAVGPSVTGWRRLQLGELCGICVARSGIAAETGNGRCRFAGILRDGSDGTRTRDLRRDRPRKGRHDPPCDDGIARIAAGSSDRRSAPSTTRRTVARWFHPSSPHPS